MKADLLFIATNYTNSHELHFKIILLRNFILYHGRPEFNAVAGVKDLPCTLGLHFNKYQIEKTPPTFHFL